jgi:predicted PurR-regulated permease PerM
MPSWFATSAQRQRLVLSAILIVGFLVLLYIAWKALVPFFLGLMVAYIMLPMVNFLDRHAPKFMQRIRVARPVAILIVYILGLAIISGLLSYFIPMVSAQFGILVQRIPSLLARIESLMLYDFQDILESIPPEIRKTVESSLQNVSATLLNAIQQGLAVTISTISQTVSFVVGMIIIPFWLFYVLNDDTKIRHAMYRAIPEAYQEDVRCIVRIVDDLLSAYVRGQILLSVLVGVTAMIFLLIMGVDLALLLGTIAGIFEVIPILGPYLGAIPAVLLALNKRPMLAVWVALGFFAIQQIENIFLVPRIAGNAVRFHPAVIMVILVVASQVAGLWGLVLGVPIAAVVRDVFQYLYLRTSEQGATPHMAIEALQKAHRRKS